jgi:hypothetical protein
MAGAKETCVCVCPLCLRCVRKARSKDAKQKKGDAGILQTLLAFMQQGMMQSGAWP